MYMELTARVENNPKCLVYMKTGDKEAYHVMLLETVTNFLVKMKHQADSAILCRHCVLDGAEYSTDIMKGVFRVRLYDEQRDSDKLREDNRPSG